MNFTNTYSLEVERNRVWFILSVLRIIYVPTVALTEMKHGMDVPLLNPIIFLLLEKSLIFLHLIAIMRKLGLLSKFRCSCKGDCAQSRKWDKGLFSKRLVMSILMAVFLTAGVNRKKYLQLNMQFCFDFFYSAVKRTEIGEQILIPVFP